MGQSGRSKTRRKFLAIKRKEVFAPVEDQRLLELASKQASGGSSDSAAPASDSNAAADSGAGTMDIDAAARPKTSVGAIADRDLRRFLSANQFKKHKQRAKAKKGAAGKRRGANLFR